MLEESVPCVFGDGRARRQEARDRLIHVLAFCGTPRLIGTDQSEEICNDVGDRGCVAGVPSHSGFPSHTELLS